MMHILMFIGGLVALVLGAESLVRGASRLAISMGISSLVVGLTVVAFGTSAPEIAVSVGAALGGKTDIAVGNVVGSNIFNVLFILGVSAVIVPLAVHAQIIRQEVPIMIGVSVLLLLFGLDGSLGLTDSLILLALMVGYTVFLVVQSRRETQETNAEYEREIGAGSRAGWDAHWAAQLTLIVVGLGLLVLGADWLVDASVHFARALGVSDLVIGLTVVAAGTSMPEVATSIMAAFRGERDIAIGNVVGSCTFNIIGCLGITGLVAPNGIPLPPAVMNFDIWVMLAVAFACLPIFLTGREIARWEGLLFLGYYAAYTIYLIMRATHHEALPAFSGIMLSFVVPLTVITLVVSALRRPSGTAR